MIMIDSRDNIAAVSPDGTPWFIGEKVLIGADGFYRKEGDPPLVKRIAGFHDGKWEPDAKDVESAYFQFDDGWMTRPWLVSKIST